MDKSNLLDQLKIEIESKREELHEVILKDKDTDLTLKISTELDDIITSYIRMVEECDQHMVKFIEIRNKLNFTITLH